MHIILYKLYVCKLCFDNKILYYCDNLAKRRRLKSGVPVPDNLGLINRRFNRMKIAFDPKVSILLPDMYSRAIEAPNFAVTTKITPDHPTESDMSDYRRLLLIMILHPT